MLAILLAAAVGACPADLSPGACDAIRPVLEAIAAERATQAALPKDEREKLERMGRLDQAGRRALGQVDFSRAPAAERGAARKAMGDALDAIDHANQAELLKMVPAEGWFSFSRYGRPAASAAFHIVQHSNVEQWRRFVPVIEQFVTKGEAEGQSYALMFDRLAIVEGRPQRYGSQFNCSDGKMQPYPLEDPVRIDELRRSMGLTQPFAEYKAMAAQQSHLCVGR